MQGYYRFPTIYKDKIVFVSEDDLWIVEIGNNNAYRLTANLSPVHSPHFSPDGKWIAYVGTEDGNTEIYVMPSSGGESKRLTYEGANISKIASWHKNNIIYASDLNMPFGRTNSLRKISINSHQSESLNLGIASNISISEEFTLLGRNTSDPARWKRYKGGTAGEIWIDKSNSDKYTQLINLKGNLACPMVVGSRAFFISDHNGISNLYSCLKSGKSLKQHTFHKNYYARNASTDQKSIVYHSGGDIYVLDIKTGKNNKIPISYKSGHVNKSRKFADTSRYLEDVSLNKNSKIINIISRGKSFSMGNWSGPAIQHGMPQGVRYRHMLNLTDDNKILLSSDFKNRNNLEIYSLTSNKLLKRYDHNLGRILNIKKSPVNDSIAFSNHKHQLHIFDIKKGKGVNIAHSSNHPLQFNWSPDGKFIAYSTSKTSRCSIIKIYDIKLKKSFEVTDPINTDFSPVFSNDGKYLAFISKRTFNPVYDSIQFDLNFTESEKPYIICLSKDTDSPFIKNPNPPEVKKNKKTSKTKKINVKIDFNGIKDRILEIPIKESIVDNSFSFYDNKIFYMKWPITGSREDGWYNQDSNPSGMLYKYDLNTLKESLYYSNISDFKLDQSNGKIIILVNNSIRVLDSKTSPAKDISSKYDYSEESGLIDLSRIKINININEEWKQMFSEAWRLQKEYFWTADMSNINWKKIYNRYYKLVDRVGSRGEFSDLIWEMQGELGTSHCYEFGGDYKPRRYYNLGNLGCNLKYNNTTKQYKITSIHKGDLWAKNPSPLLRPSLNIKTGNHISRINNIKLSKDSHPGELLLNQNNKEILLTVTNKNGKQARNLTVKTISSINHLVYRDWVEKNRQYVHKKSKGKIGYVHIPDMGADGFAEFHRYFLAEIIYDGLIVDVRFNGGGHVSQILLSKLAKKRIGFDLTRWMGIEPYPSESPGGPMCAITNEYAGSDGDIFSHSWKLMNLGKIIGRRTWGGVIGIWPRNALVDGTLTTQPEFSFWFKDVGWSVENYGTEVDEEVNILPNDYKLGKDPQLDRALSIVKKDLQNKKSVLKADLTNKPNLKLP